MKYSLSALAAGLVALGILVAVIDSNDGTQTRSQPQTSNVNAVICKKQVDPSQKLGFRYKIITSQGTYGIDDASVGAGWVSAADRFRQFVAHGYYRLVLTKYEEGTYVSDYRLLKPSASTAHC